MKKFLLFIAITQILASCDDSETKNNIRDDHCDNSTEIICDTSVPQCGEDTILAYIDGCYECVNPETCLPPWEEPVVCYGDDECEYNEWCNPCGGSSCENCEDCVSTCTAHSCTTQTPEELECYMTRPECSENYTAIIEDGCYLCIDPVTCETSTTDCIYDSDCDTDQYCGSDGICTLNPCSTDEELNCYAERPECGPGRTALVINGCWRCAWLDGCVIDKDEDCNDGTQALCDMMEPVCEAGEILAVQNYCYACVNPTTCMGWGDNECLSDEDCSPNKYCNGCATSSCPDCDDCIGACIEHECPTEYFLTCSEDRPDCDTGEFAVIEEGCWSCTSEEMCIN
ncbi:MAG: hypothetical protein JXR95_07645 [Deltaproteobacteria bacterium]|nr:hypothetical protein [Deltaproteobacteria bacterium]